MAGTKSLCGKTWLAIGQWCNAAGCSNWQAWLASLQTAHAHPAVGHIHRHALLNLLPRCRVPSGRNVTVPACCAGFGTACSTGLPCCAAPAVSPSGHVPTTCKQTSGIALLGLWSFSTHCRACTICPHVHHVCAIPPRWVGPSTQGRPAFSCKDQSFAAIQAGQLCAAPPDAPRLGDSAVVSDFTLNAFLVPLQPIQNGAGGAGTSHGPAASWCGTACWQLPQLAFAVQSGLHGGGSTTSCKRISCMQTSSCATTCTCLATCSTQGSR